VAVEAEPALFFSVALRTSWKPPESGSTRGWSAEGLLAPARWWGLGTEFKPPLCTACSCAVVLDSLWLLKHQQWL